MFFLTDRDGKPTGEKLRLFFVGIRDYYFRVPRDTERPDCVVYSRFCLDHETCIWAVPHEKAVRVDE